MSGRSSVSYGGPDNTSGMFWQAGDYSRGPDGRGRLWHEVVRRLMLVRLLIVSQLSNGCEWQSAWHTFYDGFLLIIVS